MAGKQNGVKITKAFLKRYTGCTWVENQQDGGLSPYLPPLPLLRIKEEALGELRDEEKSGRTQTHTQAQGD